MEFQIEIIKSIQSMASSTLDNIFTALTISTEVPIIVIFAAIMYWCINKEYGQKILFTIIGNITINTGIKEILKVDRPIGIEGIESSRVHTAGGYAFPSGHTQTATSFWTSLMIIFQKVWIYIIGIIVVIGVGISRLYLGVHWATDVLGGWILGILCTIVLLKVLEYSKRENSYLILVLFIIPFSICAYILKSESYLEILGLFIGFILGYIVENEFIGFDTVNNYRNMRISVFKKREEKIKRNLKSTMIKRFVLGIVTLGALYLGLEYIMPDEGIYNFYKYLIIVFYAVAGAPALFKIFKLA